MVVRKLYTIGFHIYKKKEVLTFSILYKILLRFLIIVFFEVLQYISVQTFYFGANISITCLYVILLTHPESKLLKQNINFFHF